MTKRKSKATIITANGRTISKQELQDFKQIAWENYGKLIAEDKFNQLMQSPPDYAIQTRADGYPYLKHGYVRMKMIEIFGMDWDFEIMPVYQGEPYRHVPADKALSSPEGFMTFGKLTLRLNPLDSKGMPSWEQPIVKVLTGSGWASWRKSMPYGKAVNASESNAFRRCAFPLGPALGLTLYWDDSAMYEQHNAPPTTLPELWSRLKAINKGIGLIEAAKLLDCDVSELSDQFDADPAGVWEVLSQRDRTN